MNSAPFLRLTVLLQSSLSVASSEQMERSEACRCDLAVTATLAQTSEVHLKKSTATKLKLKICLLYINAVFYYQTSQ